MAISTLNLLSTETPAVVIDFDGEITDEVTTLPSVSGSESDAIVTANPRSLLATCFEATGNTRSGQTAMNQYTQVEFTRAMQCLFAPTDVPGGHVTTAAREYWRHETTTEDASDQSMTPQQTESRESSPTPSKDTIEEEFGDSALSNLPDAETVTSEDFNTGLNRGAVFVIDFSTVSSEPEQSALAAVLLTRLFRWADGNSLPAEDKPTQPGALTQNTVSHSSDSDTVMARPQPWSATVMLTAVQQLFATDLLQCLYETASSTGLRLGCGVSPDQIANVSTRDWNRVISAVDVFVDPPTQTPTKLTPEAFSD
jgi:hypothetical protein